MEGIRELKDYERIELGQARTCKSLSMYHPPYHPLSSTKAMVTDRGKSLKSEVVGKQAIKGESNIL
jgi:hypothetical protein